MDNKEKALAGSLMFKGIDGPLLQQLADIAQEKLFRRGEAIFLEGAASSGFHMLVDGQVKVFKMSLDGREQILYVLGPGEPFGLVPVFHGQHFPASAVSMTPSATLFFPRQEFLGLIAAHPSLSMSILAVLSLRLRRFAAKVESLSLKEVPGRLAAHLIYLAEEQGSTEQVVLDIPKKQLANLLGTTPETLSRILGELSGEGLIQVDGKKIQLLRYGKLRERGGCHEDWPM